MPQASPETSASRSEATRAALLQAALERFGAKGFEATSTREIAAAANANIASIAYHFGGKHGLRLACADFVVESIEGILGRALGATGEAASLEPEAARERLLSAASAMIDAIVVRPEAEPIARFVLSELNAASAGFDRVYAGVWPLHVRFCLLWSRVTGARPESEETRLGAFAMIAQIVYFRLARPVVLRRMDWDDVGPKEAAAIKRVVLANFEAALNAARKAAP